MLYTVVPAELVTGMTTEIGYAHPRTLCEAAVDGGIAEGRMTARGLVLTRLISTDPRMYLDRRYQPGRIIRIE